MCKSGLDLRLLRHVWLGVMERKGKERNTKETNSIIWLGGPNEKILSIGKLNSLE